MGEYELLLTYNLYTMVYNDSIILQFVKPTILFCLFILKNRYPKLVTVFIIIYTWQNSTDFLVL